ncbi:MAG: hypothetical protein WKF97_01230 [Chitinophagaceae bacterium]
MKAFKMVMALFFVVLISSLVGIFKGSEAKHKWILKIRNKYDNRRQVADQSSPERSGDVLLDEIELASYHREM